jgi:hypothetical protein
MKRMRTDTPGGFDALYTPNTAVRSQIDDLSTVAGRLRDTEKHLNVSSTASQLGWMGYLQNIYEALGKGELIAEAGLVAQLRAPKAEPVVTPAATAA